MSISTTTDYNTTAGQLIQLAYQTINVCDDVEEVTPEQYSYALNHLNNMVKAWQGQSYHLWKKKVATIFTQKNQSAYVLNSTGDNATLLYARTYMTVAGNIGDTSIIVNDIFGINVGDYLGIGLADNSRFWTTVLSIDPLLKKINFPVGVTLPQTVAASTSNPLYAYSTKLDQPFDVQPNGGVRREDSGSVDDRRDVPLMDLSYDQYLQLPNKFNTGTPTSYTYDRQLANANIYLWPTPVDDSNLILLTIYTKIRDFDLAQNNPDFPQEWYDAVVYNLAVRIAPKFGKNVGDKFASLRQDAANALALAKAFDNEPGSIYFRPNFQG